MRSNPGSYDFVPRIEKNEEKEKISRAYNYFFCTGVSISISRGSTPLGMFLLSKPSPGTDIVDFVVGFHSIQSWWPYFYFVLGLANVEQHSAGEYGVKGALDSG